VTAAPVRRSAMYRLQLAQNARFKDEAGWRIAEAYTSADGEVEAARRGVGLHDASPCGKLGIRGGDVEALAAGLTGGPPPAVGMSAREQLGGGAVLLCRLAADELLVLTGPADFATVEDAVTKAAEKVGCAHPTDLTSAFAAMDLVGPRVGALLERLLPLDCSEAALPPLAVTQGELAHVHAIVLRLGERLPAFRVLVGREYGEFVWRSLAAAGGDLGLAPIGATARARLAGEGG